MSELQVNPTTTPSIVGKIGGYLTALLGLGITTPPEAGPIVDKVANFIRRFVFLKDESIYTLLAAWVIATHMAEDFEYAGYVFVYSAEPHCGKSTLLKVFDVLVASSSGVQIAPSPAVLFRTSKGRTQILDELDSYEYAGALRSVLNAGFEKGSIVTRCDKNADGGQTPTPHEVYAPRALAGIGVGTLSLTTRDRTFMVEMVPQKKTEKRERIRRAKSEGQTLRAEIKAWVSHHRARVIELYEAHDFDFLEQLFSDRTIDITEPLAAILQCVGEETGNRTLTRELVNALAITRNEQQAALPEHKLLRRLLESASEDNPLVGSATEFVAMCANMEVALDEFTIGRMLTNYGFKPKSRRTNGQPRYMYSLTRAKLQDLVDRFAGEEDTTEGVVSVVREGGTAGVAAMAEPETQEAEIALITS